MEKTKLLWFAFLSSIGIYGALPLLVAPSVNEPDAVVAYALAAAGAMAAVMSFVVPTLVERSAPTPRPEGFAFTLCILRWAIAEGVAICGVGLFLLGHGAIHAWGFALAAGVLMVVHAPGADTSQSSQDLARADVKIG